MKLNSTARESHLSLFLLLPKLIMNGNQKIPNPNGRTHTSSLGARERESSIINQLINHVCKQLHFSVFLLGTGKNNPIIIGGGVSSSKADPMSIAIPQFAKSGAAAAAASNLFLRSCRTLSSISLFRSSGSPHLPLKPSISWVTTVKASETREAKTSNSTKAEEEAEDFYEVELVQPYGLKFRKGRDGGTYIDAIAPGGSADKTGLFTVGDKVIATRYLSLSVSLSDASASAATSFIIF